MHPPLRRTAAAQDLKLTTMERNGLVARNGPGISTNRSDAAALTAAPGAAAAQSSPPPSAAVLTATTSSEALEMRASIDRVLSTVDLMSKQPPPRVLTLDLTDLHGVRVTVSLDEGTATVSVSDSGAGGASARQWQDQLDQLLDDRRNNRGKSESQLADAESRAARQSLARPDRSNELRI